MKDKCKELSVLIEKLRPKSIIHITRKSNYYHFIEYRNQKLFFDIPNHKSPNTPYKKSIPGDTFCKLINKLEKKSILINKDFPFNDCRKAAFYGFVNILYDKKV